MKNGFIKILLFALIAAPLTSQAFVEARGTYGALASKQDLVSLCGISCTTSSNAPSIVPTVGFGADVLIKIPFFPIGFGARYENMGLSASSNSIAADIKYTRTALLLNYRLIDTIVHFGPIASYGLSHTGSATIKENGTSKVDFSASSMTSYSIGLELEVKPLIVIPIVVGAEAGYMNFQWPDTTNSIDGSKKSIDLSGTYLKVFLGLDI